MSFEVIAEIILVCSFLGAGIIILRKIPALSEVPEIPAAGIKWKDILLNLKERIKNLSPFKSFSQEVFLQKVLSKIRILNLKSENKIGRWLQKLREESQRKKIEAEDNYWEEIKTSSFRSQGPDSSQSSEFKKSANKKRK